MSLLLFGIALFVFLIQCMVAFDLVVCGCVLRYLKISVLFCVCVLCL